MPDLIVSERSEHSSRSRRRSDRVRRKTGSEEEMSIGKIILIIGLVLSCLVAVVIGAGVYWWSENKDQVLGQLMEEKEEWVAFGNSTDNDGCFAESLRRHDSCGTFPCHLENDLFLAQCLQESLPTPGFCDDVPAKTEFLKTVTWRVARCSEMERDGSYCNQLVGVLQKFCGRSTEGQPSG
jgi:hypothetical protein